MAHSSSRVSALIAELQQLLEEERRILLSGSPKQITDVVARKLMIAEKIETECKKSGSATPSGEALIALDRYNRGNSIICSTMIRHLTQTIDRLRQRECHRSYMPDGAENKLPRANPLGAA
jgi:flagellar biosynthesis/type III secretory pathway chaperone